jgi:DNA repair protein RadD
LKDSDKRILDFQNGYYDCIVNKDQLTTGFDHPPIDLIGDLQPTMSPGKHVQKWGRGTRPSPATQKNNCLGLDFAGNVRRLGPINDPVKPRKPGQGGGDAPIRICDSCGAYNHASARTCCNCGIEFSFETKIFGTAGTEAFLRSDAPIVEYFKVAKVIYNLHEKKDSNGILTSPPSIKVSYFCGLRKFDEWVMLEHKGMASKRARDWWRSRHQEEPPPTTYQALQRVSELRTPSQIRVWVNKKYPDILGYEY